MIQINFVKAKEKKSKKLRKIWSFFFSITLLLCIKYTTTYGQCQIARSNNFIFYIMEIIKDGSLHIISILVISNVNEIIKNISMGNYIKSKFNCYRVLILKYLTILELSIQALIHIQSYLKRYLYQNKKQFESKISNKYCQQHLMGKTYHKFCKFIEKIDDCMTWLNSCITILIIANLIFCIFSIKKKLHGIKLNNLKSKSLIYKRWIKFITILSIILILDIINLRIVQEYDSEKAINNGLEPFIIRDSKYPSNVKVFCNLDILIFLLDFLFVYGILFFCPVKLRYKKPVSK